MTRYGTTSGNSGVQAYEIGADFILVQFPMKPPYKYSYRSCGRETVEEMKRLAKASKGLSTYISQRKPPYEE
jgi:hypothetical protein